MKSILYISMAMLLAFTTACNRTYTSASSILPVSQAPVAHKAKGDISIKAAYDLHDSKDKFELSTYFFLPVRGVDLDFHGAITDQFSLGLGYQYSWDLPYSNHSFTPSFNFFKNYESRKAVDYGFDILAGVNFSFGNNYMEVDEIFHNIYVDNSEEETIIYYDYDYNQLGYYKIKEGNMRWFVQPSFTLENSWSEFHIGTNLSWSTNFKYESELTIAFDDFFEDQSNLNPLVYYANQNHFFTGETFIGYGVGPEFLRFTILGGIGYGSDQMQHTYWFTNVGIRSNFSGLKKKSNN